MITAAVLVAGLVWMWAPAKAGATQVDVNLVGYLAQNSVDDLGYIACVPSTIVNHFVYLENRYPDLEQLLISGGSSYNNWKTTASSLIGQMHDSAQTEHGGFYPDYAHHFDAVHQRVTDAAQQRDLPVSFHMMVAPRDPNALDSQPDITQGRPGLTHGTVTREYLQHFLGTHHAGQLAMSPPGGGDGHAVLLVGMDNEHLHIIDPEDPSPVFSSNGMVPQPPARALPARYHVAPPAGHIFHATTSRIIGGKWTLVPASVTEGQIYFKYAAYPGVSLPYRGYPLICMPDAQHTCHPGDATCLNDQSQTLTIGYCRNPSVSVQTANPDIEYPNRVQCNPNERCVPYNRTERGYWYIDSVLFVEVGDGDQKRSTAEPAQLSARASVGESNAQQRADKRCLDAKYRAVQRHNHCSMVAQAAGRPGAGCDLRLRRTLAKAERKTTTCPTGITADEYVSASHNHAEDRLEEVGIFSSAGTRCAKRLARAQARHSRCEQISQWHERYDRDMGGFRDRCEQRFERRWERIRNSSAASSCTQAAEAAAVMAATVEALTPTSVHEVKTPFFATANP